MISFVTSCKIKKLSFDLDEIDSLLEPTTKTMNVEDLVRHRCAAFLIGPSHESFAFPTPFPDHLMAVKVEWTGTSTDSKVEKSRNFHGPCRSQGAAECDFVKMSVGREGQRWGRVGVYEFFRTPTRRYGKRKRVDGFQWSGSSKGCGESRRLETTVGFGNDGVPSLVLRDTSNEGNHSTVHWWKIRLCSNIPPAFPGSLRPLGHKNLSVDRLPAEVRGSCTRRNDLVHIVPTVA